MILPAVSVGSWWTCGKARCVRRLEYIVDLVNVFNLLRTQNDRSAVALDRVIAIHKPVNVCEMDAVNGVDGA